MEAELDFFTALEQGVALFNRQEFFAAHEVWERRWSSESADERRLLQGLIQVAAGFYKLQSGAPAGTVKLLAKGEESLAPFTPALHGLALAALLTAVGDWKRRAALLLSSGGRDYDPRELPRIAFARPW